MSNTSELPIPVSPAEFRRRKIVRLTDLLSVWQKEPPDAMFGATIHEYGGEEVDVRLQRDQAIAALQDTIQGLVR